MCILFYMPNTPLPKGLCRRASIDASTFEKSTGESIRKKEKKKPRASTKPPLDPAGSITKTKVPNKTTRRLQTKCSNAQDNSDVTKLSYRLG